MSEENDEGLLLKHHEQNELCTSRPPYRQGRKLTAVKTYTINNESVYLLIFGVPKINLRSELKTQCKKYGSLVSLTASPAYRAESFTECFTAKYERIQSARVAKRKLDTRNFFGGILHVCYAPELETVEETGAKLEQRRFEVSRQLVKYELSTRTVVDMLEKDTNTLVDNSFDIKKPVPFFHSTQNETSSNISKVSLPHCSKYPSFFWNPFPIAGPVQVESIPDALPSVIINNLPSWSDGSNVQFKKTGISMFSNEDFTFDPSAGFSANNANCDTSLSSESKRNQNGYLSGDNKTITKNNKPEYVFKTKRKKSKMKRSNDVKNCKKFPNTLSGYKHFLNSVEILKDSGGTRDGGHSKTTNGDYGIVTICNTIDKPKIVKLPQRPVNKIVFNIKNDKQS